MLLRDIQELSYQEIADRLHLPEGTVKSRINRGRTELARQIRRLRDELEPPRVTAADTARHRSRRMNLTTEQNSGIAIVRVGETRHDVPAAGRFLGRRRPAAGAGHRKVLLDFTKVTYVDSATIGCLMDLYRQTTAAGGTLKLAGVQKRVETMLTMTGRAQFSRDAPRRGQRRQKLRELTMRTIKTTSGLEIALDGDLLAVLEALFQEVTAKRELERSYEDLTREINHLIAQMTPDEVARLLRREPVPQPGEVRERQARSVHAEAGEEVTRVSVQFPVASSETILELPDAL